MCLSIALRCGSFSIKSLREELITLLPGGMPSHALMW